MAPQPVVAREKLTLHWTGAAECSDAERVKARVVQLIGGSIESQLAEPLDVLATVKPKGEAELLQLTLTDRQGTHVREISATSCAEMVEASALVLALAINPDFVHRRHSTAATLGDFTPTSGMVATPQTCPACVSVVIRELASEAQKPPSCAVSQQPIAPRREVRPPVAPRLHVGMSGEGRFGLFPRPAAGLGAKVTYERLPLAFSLSAHYLRASDRVSGAYARGISADTILLSPRVCWFVATSALSVGPCAALPVGYTWVRAFGVDQGKRQQHWLELTEFGLSARWFHRGAGYLALEGDLAVPWQRTRYEVSGQEVARAQAVGGRIELESGILF